MNCRFFLPGALILLITVPAAAQSTLPSVYGGRIACQNQRAAEHRCQAVDMLSRMSVDDLQASPGGNVYVNDIWGWTDPLSGREYALVGRDDAVAFVDVTDPFRPTYMGHLPSYGRARSVWRDMKVYKDHMFVVQDGRGNNGMQVFDLSQLRNWNGNPVQYEASTRYTRFSKAHNVAINEETGFAYVVGSDSGCRGLHMVDIRSPLDPTYVGCFADRSTGRRGDGYTHDTQCVIYRGPDSDYYGKELCFSSNENALSIADVTDKTDPVAVAATQYPNAAYTHQGWLTEDHRYFVMNDEGDEIRQYYADRDARTRMLIWDVVEVDDPILLMEFKGSSETIDHNLFVRDGYVFASNYTAGLRIIKLPDRPSVWHENVEEVAYFDTYPDSDELNYDGAWAAYPFFPSGNIAVLSNPEGLFMLEATNLEQRTSTEAQAELPATFTLSSAYPNPFNPQTTFTLNLPLASDVSVDAYDMSGRHVANLLKGTVSAGSHQVIFNAAGLPSGTYVVHARSGHFTATQHVLLVK